MTPNARSERLRQIRSDIERHGLSVTLVTGGPLPRYAYTIGLRGDVGFDLILPGASYYTAHQVHQIANGFATTLRADSAARLLDVPSLGSFSLRFAHDSWTRFLALGAIDFYGVDAVSVAQIVPDADHVTIDVPDMEREWDPTREPVWRWLDLPWDYPVSPESIAVTNLAALQGAPITELARWEESEWEMFAGPGPDVAPDEVRAVPLGTLVGSDASLVVALRVGVGDGYWREDATSDWHEWKRRK